MITFHIKFNKLSNYINSYRTCSIDFKRNWFKLIEQENDQDKLNASEDITSKVNDEEATGTFSTSLDMHMGTPEGKNNKKGDKKGSDKKGSKDKKKKGDKGKDGPSSPDSVTAGSPTKDDDKKGSKGGFFKFGSGRKVKKTDSKSKRDSSEPVTPPAIAVENPDGTTGKLKVIFKFCLSICTLHSIVLHNPHM